MRKFVFGVALALVAACTPSAQEIEREVSTDASVTGVILVAAWRSCKVVGAKSVDDCVRLPGKLVQEVAAQALAETAVGQRNDFLKTCQAHYSLAYCQDLLQRAATIAMNTPRS